MVHANLLLARLPLAVLERLDRRLESVDLLRGQILQRAGDPTRFAYFPTSGLVSLLALTADGPTLELASVGHEGLVGLPIILPASRTCYQAVVQISGTARRLRADLLAAELADSCGAPGGVPAVHRVRRSARWGSRRSATTSIRCPNGCAGGCSPPAIACSRPRSR